LLYYDENLNVVMFKNMGQFEGGNGRISLVKAMFPLSRISLPVM
jgi:hypothetical protein